VPQLLFLHRFHGQRPSQKRSKTFALAFPSTNREVFTEFHPTSCVLERYRSARPGFFKVTRTGPEQRSECDRRVRLETTIEDAFYLSYPQQALSTTCEFHHVHERLVRSKVLGSNTRQCVGYPRSVERRYPGFKSLRSTGLCLSRLVFDQPYLPPIRRPKRPATCAKAADGFLMGSSFAVRFKQSC
jgi:hypothetical protein